MVDEKAKGSFSDVGTSSDLRESLKRSSEKFLENVINEIFERRRDYFTFELTKILDEMDSGQKGRAEAEGSEWIEIESLSRLRTVVGGRFASLKEKWIEAGFPLRKHRGDTASVYELDEKGWLSLSAWISKQGFEAQLPNADSKWLFKLKPLPGSIKSK